MSSNSPICPRCGTVNPSSLNICWKCGTPLTGTPSGQNVPAQFPGQSPPAQSSPNPVPSQLPPSPVQSQLATPPISQPPGQHPPATGSTPYPSQYPPTTTSTFYQDMMEAKRRKEISHTKNGLMLIIVGMLIGIGALLRSVIGVAAGIFFIGGIVELAGAILVILGRSIFGKKHSNNVLICIALFVGGFVAAIAAGGIFGFLIVAVTLNRDSIDRVTAANTITTAFNVLTVGTIVEAVLLGLAMVLFTYSLQRPNGRGLLWAAYGVSLALAITTAVLTLGGVNSVVQTTLATGVYDPTPIDALQSQLEYLALFGLIPTTLYVVAYYLVWNRINLGELPAPVPIESTVPSLPISG